MQAHQESPAHIQNLIANKYLNMDVLNQYEFMQAQNQILTSIHQLLQKRQNHPPMETIENSSISYLNYNSNNNDDSVSLMNKSKFTEQFEQSILQSALKEVKGNCSGETYSTIRLHTQKSKVKQIEGLMKNCAELKQEKEDLKLQLLISNSEKNQIKKELEKLRKIVNGIEEEKNHVKNRVDYVLKKQDQIYKLQSSMIFKEKINLELKKKYQRLRDFVQIREKKFEELYEELNKLWKMISGKVEAVSCPADCWRKDVMKRAKDQLVEERKLLKEEAHHIEKEYEVMNVVSEQFKKIFQQPKNKTLSSNTEQFDSSKSIQSVQMQIKTPKSCSEVKIDIKKQ